jgi:streptomycin 6-kinase
VTLAQQWGLTLVGWLPGGRTACVLEVATDSGAPAVLKIPISPADTRSERIALGYWDGGGTPKLLGEDDATGALLLEAIAGRPADEAPGDDGVVGRVAALLGRLHRRDGRPLPGLPSLEEKIGPLRRLREREEARRGGPRLGAATIGREEAVREWLIATEDPARARVIHGDFQPRNLLVGADRSLTAIDPYGVIGEPERDVAYVGLMLGADGRAWRRLASLAGLVDADLERVRSHAYLIAVGAHRFRRAYAVPGGVGHLEEFIARYEASRAGADPGGAG